MGDRPVFLFRGTTSDWRGSPTQDLGRITPTTTDPLVATYFAIECRNKGRAVVLAVRRGVLPELEAENHFAVIEGAVNLDLAPLQFQQKAEHLLEVDRAIQHLGAVGVEELPMRISSHSLLHQYLRDARKHDIRLNVGQIEHFNSLMLGG